MIKSRVQTILLASFVLANAWPASAYASDSLPLRGALPSDAGTTVAPSSGSGLTAPRLLHETVSKDSPPSAPNNSVEKFFQIGPSQVNNPHNLLLQPATVIPARENTSKWRASGFCRGMWHVLDNIGVPMFLGQDTNFIDPSIKATYLIPAPLLPRSGKQAEELEKTAVQINQAGSEPPPPASQTVLQKIPVTELEGIPLPTPRDDDKK